MNDHLIRAGLSPDTLATLQVQVKADDSTGEAYATYPTYMPDASQGAWRVRYDRPLRSGIRYSWLPGQNLPRPLLYNLHAYQPGQPLWLVDSEMAVWFAEQEGFHAAALLIPWVSQAKAAAELLHAAGVKELNILMASGDYGQRLSAGLAFHCERYSMEPTVHHWAGTVGYNSPGYSASDYAQRCLSYAVPIGEEWGRLPVASKEQVKAWALLRRHDPPLLQMPGTPRPDGPVRSAYFGGCIYLDLADTQESYHCIAPHGSNIEQPFPHLFARSPDQDTLPTPVPVTTHPEQLTVWNEFRDLLQIQDDMDWMLLVGWMVAVLRPSPHPHAPLPLPVLLLTGEVGKTETARAIKRTVDPSKLDIINASDPERMMVHAGRTSRVVCIDNVTAKSNPRANERLASFATGAAYLSSDGPVALASGVILSLDKDGAKHLPAVFGKRALRIRLPNTGNARLIPLQVLRDRFKALHPRLLGCICEAMSHGLKNLPRVQEKAMADPDFKLLTFADWVLWVVACEPALPWQRGEFYPRVQECLGLKNPAAGKSERMIAALIYLLQEDNGIMFESPKSLYERLYHAAVKLDCEKNVKGDAEFPKNAKSMGNRLARLKAQLAARRPPIIVQHSILSEPKNAIQWQIEMEI